MIGATRSGLFWIIGCVCALFFGQEVMAQGDPYGIATDYGVRPRDIQPAVTPEQRAAAEKLVEKYLVAAEAERPPMVDELKKMGVASQFVVREQANATRRAAVIAEQATKKAEADGKTEEAAKLRADGEKAAAKSDALAKLLTLIATGAAVQPPTPKLPPESRPQAAYGIRARE
jgi:hypothetical protein